MMSSQQIPVPQSYYTSPLTRCLQTANITFANLKLPPQTPFKPVVKESFRETISGHTCDRRSDKSFIQDILPSFTFESGFADKDTLWQAHMGETDADQDVRSHQVLSDVFDNDDNTFISVTSHSMEIASILRGTSRIDVNEDSH